MPASPEPTPPSRRPIVILGVMNRCGSNYLHWLLSRHPDVVAAEAGRSGEDYLLKRADLLTAYAADTVRHWSAEGRDELASRAMAAMGAGLLGLVTPRDAGGRRPLMRTPRPFHLDRAAELFPDGQLVLLMRDGRDVVASAEKTFAELPRGEAARRWADGADQLWRYTQGEPAGESPLPWTVVRYESLKRDIDGELGRVLDRLGLDRAAYPWDDAASAPVIGSSIAKPDGAGKVDWRPIAKPAGFDAAARWAGWSWWQRRQFDRVCGPAMRRWGYGSAGARGGSDPSIDATPAPRSAA